MTSQSRAEGSEGRSSQRRAVTRREAWLFWLKLGFIGFGGPAGQIAIMHTELVERRRWISEKRFLHALNYCMVLPGPEAQQLATYLGWLMHRTWGGIVAGALFVLPSLLIMIALGWIYVRFNDLPWVGAALYGIKPAVAAIVVHAAWRIGSRSIRDAWNLGIAIGAFAVMLLLHWPFPAIVAGAALIGFVRGRGPSVSAAVVPGQVPAARGSVPAVIDDDTPLPPHAKFSRRRFAFVVGAGLLLWAAPMGVLVAAFGWKALLTQMSWFFTKAAFLTFGGAYAVLPYVTQAAVVDYGWLTANQMMDALALGETTPGPLIMLVAFVGFVGAYVQSAWGPDSPLQVAMLAAVLVSWFTFLPSFIFILSGGQFVESTQHAVKLAAPLAAISAAVVGLIINLAVFFGYQVLWPGGLAAGLDRAAFVLAVLAAIALFRFKWSVGYVVIATGLLGVMLRIAE